MARRAQSIECEMVQRVEGYGVERFGPGRSGEADAGRFDSCLL